MSWHLSFKGGLYIDVAGTCVAPNHGLKLSLTAAGAGGKCARDAHYIYCGTSGFAHRASAPFPQQHLDVPSVCEYTCASTLTRTLTAAVAYIAAHTPSSSESAFAEAWEINKGLTGSRKCRVCICHTQVVHI